MLILCLIPIVLSYLLIAAHFLHAGNIPLTIVSLALIGLVIVRRWWAARILQALLVLATIEWIVTALNLLRLYQEEGRPALRMLLILGGVALFTLGTVLVFLTRPCRRYFAVPEPGPDGVEEGGGSSVCGGQKK